MRRWIAHSILSLIILVSVGACATTPTHTPAAVGSVVFICEHGNVKSLMAMAYFNQIARQRGLPLVAVSRGSALDSNTVPQAIAAGLRADGFDAAEFRPTAVTVSDLSSAHRVITIGVSLPADMQSAGVLPERWDDIPPATVDFRASSQSIKAHVSELVDQLVSSSE